MTVSGVPSRGMGALLYPNNNNNSNGSTNGFNATFDLFTSLSGIFPTTLLVYAGYFDSYSNILGAGNGGFAGQAAAWAGNPRTNGSAFTDTNGKSWPARTPIIPVIGVTNWTTSEDMTFASQIAGTNDADIAAMVTIWSSRGFPEIWVRIGYEDQYPTTPAGIDSSTAKGYGQFSGTGASWAQGYGGNASLWIPAYVKAWRYYANLLHTTGAAHGCVVKTIWGAVPISYDSVNPTRFYPDSFATDGNGSVVDYHGPDFYWGAFYGDVTSLYTNYQNSPPFTASFKKTGTATSLTQWAADVGSCYHWSDYMDGNLTLTSPQKGAGWSIGEVLQWALTCPLGPKPVLFPESGLLKTGSNYVVPAGGLENIDFLRYCRSRIANFQSRGGNFLNFNMWGGQSHQQRANYGIVWPELQGSNGGGGGGGGGGNTVYITATQPATVNVGTQTITGTVGSSVTVAYLCWSDSLTAPTTSSPGVVKLSSFPGGTYSTGINFTNAGTTGYLYGAANSNAFAVLWSAVPVSSSVVTISGVEPSPFYVGTYAYLATVSTGATTANLCWRNSSIIPILTDSDVVTATLSTTAGVISATATVTFDNPNTAGVLWGSVNSQAFVQLWSGTPVTAPGGTVVSVTTPNPFYVGAQTISGTISGSLPATPLKLQWATTKPTSSDANFVTATITAGTPATFSVSLTVAGASVAATMWYMYDNTNVLVGFTGTPIAVPVSDSLTIAAVPQQTVQVPFSVVCTSNYSMTLANMYFTIDGVTWLPASNAAGGAVLSGGNETLTIGLNFLTADPSVLLQIQDQSQSPVLLSNNVPFVVSLPTGIGGVGLATFGAYGTAPIGFDTSLANLTSQVALLLAAGQKISMDVVGSVQIYEDPSTGRLCINNASGAIVLSLDPVTGNLKTSGTMTASTTP